jgi:hypothetical protein
MTATWCRLEDILAPIPGREDPESMIEAAKRYLLRAEITGVHRVHSESRAKRAQARVAASIVQQSASRVRKPDGALEQQLADAHATIDRLLAFVPSRAPGISKERIYQIASALIAATRELIPVSEPIALVGPEEDPESEARDRIAIHFKVPADYELGDLSNAIFRIHRRLAELTTPMEHRAIHLSVEPLLEG